MKPFIKHTAYALLAVMLAGPSAALYAQHDDRHDNRGDNRGQDNRGNDNHGYVHHNEWKRGYHMRQDDWNRGEHIDYRERHLPAPRRGYEWRQVDGNYVMAAVATGIIASTIIAASHR